MTCFRKRQEERKQKKAVELADEEEEEESISDIENVEVTLSEEYKEELREKARLYAQMLATMEEEGEVTIFRGGNLPETELAPATPPEIQQEEAEKEDGELLSGDEQNAVDAQEQVVEDTTHEQVVFQKPKDKKSKKKKKKRDKKEKRRKKHLLDGKFEIKFLRKQKTYKPILEPNSKDQVKIKSRLLMNF
jgi:hypothetical protein